MGFKKVQILTQNSKWLAFGFTEKHLFTAKTDWNSVFLDLKAQILYRLHIMFWYISFYGLNFFFQILAKSKEVKLAFGFTNKWQIAVKIVRNSVFLSRKGQIRDRLHIMVSYISFYVFFKKIQISAQNPKGVVAFGFIKKCQFVTKNWPKLCIFYYKT
jgi:hypothetical protein